MSDISQRQLNLRMILKGGLDSVQRTTQIERGAGNGGCFAAAELCCPGKGSQCNEFMYSKGLQENGKPFCARILCPP